ILEQTRVVAVREDVMLPKDFLGELFHIPTQPDFQARQLWRRRGPTRFFPGLRSHGVPGDDVQGVVVAAAGQPAQSDFPSLQTRGIEESTCQSAKACG